MLVDDDAPSARPPQRILFAASESSRTRAEALAAEFPGLLGFRAEIERGTIPEAAGRLSPRTQAVVLLIQRHEEITGLPALFDGVEKLGVPLLILTDDPLASTFRLTSWNTLPMSKSPEVIAAMLRGQLSRQTEIAALRQNQRGAEEQAEELQGEVSRMRDELHLAGQVQREFMPRNLAAFSGGAVAALWRPMAYVGGDIYDVRRLDEHHVGLFVADAVGHGVPAALLTMVIARGLPSKEIIGKTYRIIPPGEALACVNRELLAREGRVSKFATAIYAIIDLRTRAMRLAVAGHPPAVLLRGDRAIELAGTTGKALGVFDGVEWPEIELQLEPGDRVLLHSDGFEAAFPDPPEKPVHSQDVAPAFLEEFRALLGVPEPAALVERIERRLDQRAMNSGAGGSFADDLTLVAFKVS
ncbi:MAG: serine/threonine-protein phosphatase [Planctomycetes bacterium]|nr:serine/threonine-protein phosphatase [Planctomycetota bacterium]